MSDWLEAELSGSEFKDKRRGDRFKKIVRVLVSGGPQRAMGGRLSARH